ncbi:uncharacterized protein [Prorops nasuta]|uniref:uncharacterized protein n=1 Tax=Prorops nasuta TaxID=863751 RepID=UPI0034CF4138
MFVKSILFILVIFCIFCCKSVVSECIATSPCSCTFPNGDKYNLTKLESEGPFNSTDSNDNYEIRFQPCKNLPMEFNYPEVNFNKACSSGKGVSLCAYDKKQKTLYNLGTIDESKLALDVKKKNQLIFTLHHDNRTTYINIICRSEANCKTDFKIDNIGSNIYDLTLITPYGCKIFAPQKGLSFGSVFLIMILVICGLYFIGGALVLKFIRGATGWEMLPNHEFWLKLPMYIKDGGTFIINCCRTDSYERI